MSTAFPATVAGPTWYLEPVSSPHANRCKEKPQNKPEEIKWQAQDDGIYTVPQGNGKAGSDERNEPEENCPERWRFHAESPATDRGIVAGFRYRPTEIRQVFFLYTKMLG